MAVDRRLLINIDWVMLGAAVILAGIGMATILSATHTGTNSNLYLKQFLLFGVGLVGLLVSVMVDYRRLADRSASGACAMSSSGSS